LQYELLHRYIWLVDTIRRHGRITLDEINSQWLLASMSNGKPFSRRTFFNYRNAAQRLLGVYIDCDLSTYEYFIEQQGEGRLSLNDWLLDSMSINETLRDSRDMANRVVLENVPSAREHLPTIIDAMRQDVRVRFSYNAHTRVNRTAGIVIEPYFVKIFKQLWYVIGYNVKDGKIKTYALDRISDLNILAQEHFKMPEGFSPAAFFSDCFGITTNQNEPKRITLRVEPTQAKYFRALPLHPSQTEEVHDSYSLFNYRMRITYDLKEEIMSHGSAVEVVAPPELKALIVEELRQALHNYQPTNTPTTGK
jgi:predicted DNA-binding transcriptional regulator YafY